MIKIRKAVYYNTKEKLIIPDQNIKDLFVVMRAIYLKYAIHSSKELVKQIDDLNERVMYEIIPDVIENAISSYKFNNSNFEEFIPIPLPKKAGIKGKRVYSSLYG